MPVSRLRALSAFSILGPGVEPGQVGFERKAGAVEHLELDAFRLQIAEQLEHQRAGEPGGMEGVDALYAHGLLVDGGELDRADPGVLRFGLRAADARGERNLLAISEYGDHFQLDYEVAHLEVLKVME